MRVGEKQNIPVPIRLLRRANPVIACLLQSSAHRIASKDLLVLQYRGRKTGKDYTIPLSYVTHAGESYCVTRTESSWWKSVAGAATPTTIWLRGERRSAIGERVPSSSSEAARVFDAFLAANPRTAKLVYNVGIDGGGRPDVNDMAAAIHNSVVVRFR